MRRYLILVLLLIVVLIAIAPSAAGERMSGYTCPTNTTCHLLLEEGSEVYLLTANGNAVIVVNGADSLLIQNDSD